MKFEIFYRLVDRTINTWLVASFILSYKTYNRHTAIVESYGTNCIPVIVMIDQLFKILFYKSVYILNDLLIKLLKSIYNLVMYFFKMLINLTSFGCI